jgi:hypothetical protein
MARTMRILINASYGFSVPLDQYRQTFYCTRAEMKTNPVLAKKSMFIIKSSGFMENILYTKQLKNLGYY